MEQKLVASPLHKDLRLPELYDLYARKRAAQDRIRALKKRIQATHDVLQMEELKSRKRVLRRLGFTTADDIVDVKGRVACEISTGDELLLTELIFNGVFNPLAPEHCAGLLSCFVFTEKVRAPRKRSRDPILTFCLERTTNQAEGGTRGTATCHAGDRATHCQGLQRVQVVNRRGRIRSVVQSRAHGRCGAVVPGSVILRNLQGKFSCLLKMLTAPPRSLVNLRHPLQLTDQFEGNLIRVFRRLQELIRQMAQAAKVIGNVELQQKFEKTSEMLERPNSVIFTSSLYL
jgi:ATP-dependent RNA helicase DOB1